MVSPPTQPQLEADIRTGEWTKRTNPDGSVTYSTIPQLYIIREKGNQIQEGKYIQKEYTYKGGAFYSGRIKQTRGRTSKGGAYSESPVDYRVYQPRAQGGYQLLTYGEKDSKWKLIEKEEYGGVAQRESYEQRGGLTETQQQNLERKQEKAKEMKERFTAKGMDVKVKGDKYPGGFVGLTPRQVRVKKEYEEGISFLGTPGTKAVGRTPEGIVTTQTAIGSELIKKETFKPEETGLTRGELIGDVAGRLGFEVRERPEKGEVTLIKGGRQFVSGPLGFIEAPSTAIVRTEFIPKIKLKKEKPEMIISDETISGSWPIKEYKKPNWDVIREEFMGTTAKRKEEFQKFGTYIAQQERLGRPVSGRSQAAATVGYALVSFERGLIAPFLYPKETAIGTFKFFTHGAPEIPGLIRDEPIGTLFELGGTAAAFKIVGTTIKGPYKTVIKEPIGRWYKGHKETLQFGKLPTGEPWKLSGDIFEPSGLEIGIFKGKPRVMVATRGFKEGLPIIEKGTGAVLKGKRQSQIFKKDYDVMQDFLKEQLSKDRIDVPSDYLGKWLPKEKVPSPTFAKVTESGKKIFGETPFKQAKLTEFIPEGIRPPVAYLGYKPTKPSTFMDTFKRMFKEKKGEAYFTRRTYKEPVSQFKYEEVWGEQSRTKLPRTSGFGFGDGIKSRLKPTIKIKSIIFPVIKSKTMFDFEQKWGQRSRIKLELGLERKTMFDFEQDSGQRSRIKLGLGFKLASDVTQKQRQKQRQRQKLIPMLDYGNEFKPTDPTFDKPPEPPTPEKPTEKISSIKLFPTRRKRKKKKKKKLKFKARPLRYTATIKEAQLGIYGKMPKIITGVGPRPLRIKRRK